MAADEYPPTDWFPTWKIRLSIRFEEYGQVTTLSAKVPAATTKNLDGVMIQRDNLTIVADPSAPPGINRFLLQGSGSSSFGSGSDQVSSADGLTQELGGIVPREFNWGVNGLRTADTLSIKIKYIDCPVDPRTVRSCAVEFYLGTVTGEQFAAGIAGSTRIASPGNSAEPMNMVPDTYTDVNGNPRTNLRFQGWVDKWRVEWDDENEPFIQLECVDNTRLFMEQEAPPRLVVGMVDPIDKAVATYLSHFPQLQGLTITYQPQGDTIPTLGGVLSRTAYRPNLGPQPTQGGAGNGSKLTIWDYLTDVCGAIGHAIYLDGTNIVIQLPRTITSANITPRPDDPFMGRSLPSGMSFTNRRFIYGRNVKKMYAERNYTKKTALNVEVRSYDTEKKTMHVQRFPLPADRLAYAIPGGAQPDQKWTVIRVHGVNDDATLRKIAQTYYEVVGRNELEIGVTTQNFASFGGGNTDPDILDMKFGDAFEIYVNRDTDTSSTLTQMEMSLSAMQQNVAFMQALGFSSGFASTYAQVYTASDYPTAFRLKTLKVSGSIDEGVTFVLTGVNYVEVRADQSLAPGEEPQPAPAPPAAPPPGGPPQSPGPNPSP
jgi:hypothetical protein